MIAEIFSTCFLHQLHPNWSSTLSTPCPVQFVQQFSGNLVFTFRCEWWFLFGISGYKYLFFKVWSQTLAPVSAHLFFICLIVYFQFSRHTALYFLFVLFGLWTCFPFTMFPLLFALCPDFRLETRNFFDFPPSRGLIDLSDISYVDDPCHAS